MSNDYLKPGESINDWNLSPNWIPGSNLPKYSDPERNHSKSDKNDDIWITSSTTKTGIPIPQTSGSIDKGIDPALPRGGYSQRNFDYEALLKADKIRKVINSGAYDEIIRKEKFSKLSPIQKFLDKTRIGMLLKYALIGTVGVGLIGSVVGIISAFSLPEFASAGITGKTLTVVTMVFKGFAFPMIYASTYGPLNVLAIGASQLAGTVILFKSIFKKPTPIKWNEESADERMNKAIALYDNKEQERLHKENIKKYGRKYESSPEYKREQQKYASTHSTLEVIPNEADILAGLDEDRTPAAKITINNH